MSFSPGEILSFEVANLSAQCDDFILFVEVIIFNSGEGKEFSAMVDFLPKPVFHSFPHFAESFVVFLHVEVSEHTHYVGESVCLENADCFEQFHFKSYVDVNQKES